MAAPTNAAKREESSCQLGAVHTWHETDVTVATVHVCFVADSDKGDRLYEKRLAVAVTPAYLVLT
jgi:hypothetical protein